MSKFKISALVILSVFTFFAANLSFGAEAKEIVKDDKGKVYIFILASDKNDSALSEKIVSLKNELMKISLRDNSDSKKEYIIFQASGAVDYLKISDEISGLEVEKVNNMGGIILIDYINSTSEKTSSGKISIDAEIFNYPFLPITEEHIESPEYTFKFSSDSSLLAFHLLKHINSSLELHNITKQDLTLKPAAKIEISLERELLKKYTKICINDSVLLSKEDFTRIAVGLYNAIEDYYVNGGSYALGVIPERALQKADSANLEISAAEFKYPNKDLKESEDKLKEEAVFSIPAIRYSSNLFLFKDLAPITPYTFRIVDKSKPSDHLLYKLYEGRFVTSDLGGIVRTIPNKLKNYVEPEKIIKEDEPIQGHVSAFDYVIEDALIIDGAKDAKQYIADLAISDDKIVKIGDLKRFERLKTIDAKGMFLSPGFIDIHSHVDSTAFDAPYAQSAINQGITTSLGGNCSFSTLNVGTFYKDIETSTSAINIGILIGNRPVRKAVIGERKGQPSYAEVYRQKELVDLGMEEGAFGVSSGLIYSISEEAYTWELAELAKQVKPYGGFYASHIRGESDEVIDAAKEALFIGELAEVPVQISHIKAIGKDNWGKMEKLLNTVKLYKSRGLDVTCDQYPWLATGGSHQYRLLRLLEREAIQSDAPDTVLLKDMPGRFSKYSGKPLTELLKNENMDAFDLIRELNLNKDSKIFSTYICLSEEDLLLPMKEDFVMVCTDAGLKTQKEIDNNSFGDDHPRKFGTYPEFLGKYVRDKKVCSWELAIYKCSGLPAGRLKLKERGLIKEGYYADIVLFSPNELESGADYLNRDGQPNGINYVFVNGKPALENGKLTYLRNGKALRAYGNVKP